MIVRDRTGHSPEEYRRRAREPSEIRAAVLHQTGFVWREDNPMWDRVRAHAVVLRSGLVLLLHPLLVRMRYGCGLGNAYAINIEIEGSLPLEYRDGEPIFWRPDTYGSSVLTPEQITSGRELLAWLQGQVPGLQVGTHRQIELDRSGCCGPDIWAAIGQYGIDVLGMPEMPVDGGRDIPDSWRGANYSEIPNSSVRAYQGPLDVTG